MVIYTIRTLIFSESFSKTSNVDVGARGLILIRSGIQRNVIRLTVEGLNETSEVS